MRGEPSVWVQQTVTSRDFDSWIGWLPLLRFGFSGHVGTSDLERPIGKTSETVQKTLIWIASEHIDLFSLV